MGIAEDARRKIDEHDAGRLSAEAREQEHAAKAKLLIDEFLELMRTEGISPVPVFHREEGSADLKGRRKVWAGECIGRGWDLRSLDHGDSGSQSFFLFSDGHLQGVVGSRDMAKDHVGATVRIGRRGGDVASHVDLALLREAMVSFVSAHQSARHGGLWTRPSDYVDRHHRSG